MYFRFCTYYGLQPFPADEWQLVRFARYVANAVTSYDTVAGYLSSIKRLHELGDFVFPRNTYLLKLELMAIRRELAHLVKKAPPVTPELLASIFQHMNIQSDQEVAAYTALVVGFTLFLRKSNLVPDSVDGFNPKEQLCVEDVKIQNNMVVIEIKWSKTLQNRQKELLLPLVPAKRKLICAVFWLRYVLGRRPWLKAMVKGGGTPVFLGEKWPFDAHYIWIFE